MPSTRTVAVAVGAAAVGTVVARRVARRASGPGPRDDRWHAVTINSPEADVGGPSGPWPRPVAELGRAVEVRTAEAPGGRGTELYVRARPGRRRPKKADRLEQRIRVALRESRALVEVGEVLAPDRPSTTKRTLTSLPLELAIRSARREGRL